MQCAPIRFDRLYASRSLVNERHGFRFALVNPLPDARLTGVGSVRVDGREVSPDVVVELADGRVLDASQITPDSPALLRRGQPAQVWVHGDALDKGRHEIDVVIDLDGFGTLECVAVDTLNRPRGHH